MAKGGTDRETSGLVHTRMQASDPTDWQRSAFEEISRTLSQDDFPCLFARKALAAGSIHYAFCDTRDGEGFSQARHALCAYTAFVKSVPVQERIYQPLILVLGEAGRAAKEQHSLGWRALRWLYEHDPLAWPDHVPADPEDPEWSFCFNAVPLFVNMSSGVHLQLRSRNLGRNLVLVINPRENFDVVANIGSSKGRAIRKRIRERVEAFNGKKPSAVLGFYGDPENREWRQYQLEEAGHPAPARCPLIVCRTESTDD